MTCPHFRNSTGLAQFQMVNVTIVAPDDELQFLTAAFGPNATANTGAWVTQPSAGIARLSPIPVSEGTD